MPIHNEDLLRQRYDSLLPGNPFTMDEDEDFCCEREVDDEQELKELKEKA